MIRRLALKSTATHLLGRRRAEGGRLGGGLAGEAPHGVLPRRRLRRQPLQGRGLRGAGRLQVLGQPRGALGGHVPRDPRLLRRPQRLLARLLALPQVLRERNMLRASDGGFDIFTEPHHLDPPTL